MKRSIAYIFGFAALLSMVVGQSNFIRTYGTTTDRDHFYDVIETLDGNYLYVGTTRSGVGTSNSSNDGLLVKTDVDGNQLWHVRRGHDTQADYFFSVWEDLNGDLFVFGSQTQVGFKEHMILNKFDKHGAWLWERRIGGMSSRRFDEQGHGISGDQNFLYLFGTAYDVLAGGDADGYVQVFDKNGKQLWSLSNGHIACVGRLSVQSGADENVFFLEIKPSGGMVTSSAYLFGGSGNETGFTSTLTTDQSLLIGGWSNSPTYTHGLDDALAIKIAGGEISDVCPFQYTRLVETDLTQIITTTSFGSSRSAFKSQSPNTKDKALTLEGRVICIRNTPDMPGEPEADFRLYPSPAADNLTLDLPEKGLHSAFYTICDITGKLIKEAPVSTEYSHIQIPIADFQKGLYVLFVKEAGKTLWRSKWIKN